MVRRRLRSMVIVLALLELVVFVAVAGWIGVGWTILAALATSALGSVLLARQGVRALGELRARARSHRPAGRELGDAGLVAVGGVLMVLPGFVGDVVGLLCLLPVTRPLVRGLLARFAVSRLPVHLRPPVRVDSVRTVDGFPAPQDRDGHSGAHGPGGFGPIEPLVIEGEVVRGPDGRPRV